MEIRRSHIAGDLWKLNVLDTNEATTSSIMFFLYVEGGSGGSGGGGLVA